MTEVGRQPQWPRGFSNKRYFRAEIVTRMFRRTAVIVVQEVMSDEELISDISMFRERAARALNWNCKRRTQ